MHKLRGRLLTTLILLVASLSLAAGSVPTKAFASTSTYSSTNRAGRVTQEGEPDIGLGAKPQPPAPRSGTQTQVQKDAIALWVLKIWVVSYMWR